MKFAVPTRGTTNDIGDLVPHNVKKITTLFFVGSCYFLMLLSLYIKLQKQKLHEF